MKVRNIVLVLLLCLMQMLLPAGAWGEEARLIEQGNACYEAKDYEKAMEFYLRSVEEEDDPGALFNIGVLYAQGSGVERIPRPLWSGSGRQPTVAFLTPCITWDACTWPGKARIRATDRPFSGSGRRQRLETLRPCTILAI